MIRYSTLFEVFVYHDYFLDNGAEKFNSMSNPEKLVQLSRYNLGDYIEILPTRETQVLLKNHRMNLVQQSDGFKVVVSTAPNGYTPVIPIDGGLELRFCARIRDSYFENYTDLNLATVPNRIFLFANKRPSTESGSFPLIPVNYSNDESLPPDPDLVGNNYLATEATTTALLQSLPLEERAGLVGMFTIRMKTGDSKYDVLDAQDNIKHDDEGIRHDVYEKFAIRFQNKKCIWKYKKPNGSVFFTVEEQPLVKYGFIELDPETDLNPAQTPVPGQHFPNAGVLSFEKAFVSGGEAICSVIFI